MLKAGVAFAILIVGWIFVYAALVRTGVEARLARAMGIDEEGCSWRRSTR